MIREVDFANEDYRGLARALALGAVRGPYTSYSGDGTVELNIGEVAAEVLGSGWFAAKLAEVERAAAEKALDAVKADVWRERSERDNKYPDYHYGGMMHANTIIGNAIRALGSVPSTGEGDE